MKFPNKFKIGWWIALVFGGFALLIPRYSAFAGGLSNTYDVLVFAVWLALLLAPVFSEISIAGLTLKQQIDDLKEDVTQKIAEIRNDVRAEVRATVSPTFHIGHAPLPDSALTDIRQQVQSASIGDPVKPLETDSVPSTVGELANVRYLLETELRRLAGRFNISSRRGPIAPIIRSLERELLIDPNISNGLREVYAICSAAIHGENVSANQLSFVRDISPTILSVLRDLNGPDSEPAATS